MNTRYRSKEYILFPRKMRSGKTVWYYYTYKDGKKTSNLSTGIGYAREKDRVKSRREAVAYCERLLQSGEIGGAQGLTLRQWVNRKKFWHWKKSEYVRSIIIRSDAEKPGITEGFVKSAQQITEDHILPFHGEKDIEKITPYDCEQLLFRWSESVTNKTANNWKSVYSTILGEYERELKMKDTSSRYFNPWRMVKPLAVGKNSYGALTIAEAAKLLQQLNDNVYFLAVKLAFTTGLRIGEVCGLLGTDVKDVELKKDDAVIRGSYIHVTHSYSAKSKRRELVKDKEARDIPISADLRDSMNVEGNTGYLFSEFPDNSEPLSANKLRKYLYELLDKIGIGKGERENRKIAFHSARRFFNTLLRHERIADDVIRRFTGHDSQAMTDHYTDYLPEDLQAISEAQKRLLIGDIK